MTLRSCVTELSINGSQYLFLPFTLRHKRNPYQCSVVLPGKCWMLVGGLTESNAFVGAWYYSVCVDSHHWRKLQTAGIRESLSSSGVWLIITGGGQMTGEHMTGRHVRTCPKIEMLHIGPITFSLNIALFLEGEGGFWPRRRLTDGAFDRGCKKLGADNWRGHITGGTCPTIAWDWTIFIQKIMSAENKPKHKIKNGTTKRYTVDYVRYEKWLCMAALMQ